MAAESMLPWRPQRCCFDGCAASLAAAQRMPHIARCASQPRLARCRPWPGMPFAIRQSRTERDARREVIEPGLLGTAGVVCDLAVVALAQGCLLAEGLRGLPDSLPRWLRTLTAGFGGLSRGSEGGRRDGLLGVVCHTYLLATQLTSSMTCMCMSVCVYVGQ